MNNPVDHVLSVPYILLSEGKYDLYHLQLAAQSCEVMAQGDCARCEMGIPPICNNMERVLNNALKNPATPDEGPVFRPR